MLRLADELEHDVAGVRLDPAERVRRRGDVRRYRTVAVGAAVVAALATGAVGVAYAVQPHAAVVGSPAGLHVLVVYDLGATPAQEQAAEARMRDFWLVAGPHLRTRDEVYREFKEQYSDAPDLVKSTRPDQLPEEEELTLADPGDFARLKAALSGLPGVGDVQRL